MENEKEFDEELFLKELSELLQKHKLIDCAFCGENEDGKMIGLFCVEKHGKGYSIKNQIATYSNIARLYQSAREHFLKMFDKM